MPTRYHIAVYSYFHKIDPVDCRYFFHVASLENYYFKRKTGLLDLVLKEKSIILLPCSEKSLTP
jgi:hypothetical protein